MLLLHADTIHTFLFARRFPKQQSKMVHERWLRSV